MKKITKQSLAILLALLLTSAYTVFAEPGEAASGDALTEFSTETLINDEDTALTTDVSDDISGDDTASSEEETESEEEEPDAEENDDAASKEEESDPIATPEENSEANSDADTEEIFRDEAVNSKAQDAVTTEPVKTEPKKTPAVTEDATETLVGEGTKTETAPTTVTVSVKEGYYRLETVLAANKVLDISGASKADGANAQIYDFNGTNAQIYQVKKTAKGTYTFRNVRSGKYLRIENGGKANGTNVHQYGNTVTKGCEFVFEKGKTSGSYVIKASYANLALDVKSAKSANKTNVHAYRANGTKAQEWKLKATTPPVDAKIATGYYKITSALSSKLSLNINGAKTGENANLEVYTSNKNASQVYYVRSLGSGLYELSACHSGKALTVADSVASDRTNVAQKTYTGAKTQKWYLTKANDGTVTIASSLNRARVLDVAGGQTANRTNVRLYTTNGSKSQKWTFTKASIPQVPLETGMYEIYMTNQKEFCLDVNNFSKSVGGNIQLFKAKHNNAQRFLVVYQEDGTYTITNVNSELSLYVKDKKAASKTNVIQGKNDNSKAVRWKITGCAGRYKVQSALGNFCLDLTGGQLVNKKNIRIYSDNGTDSQRFHFERVGAAASLPQDKGIYTIATGLDKNKVIDTPNANQSEGIQMQISAAKNTDAQKFQLQSTGDGYYVIMNVYTGLVLTAKQVNSSVWDSNYNGKSVLQYNEIEGSRYKNYQKWKPEPSGDGGYYLRNYNGLYLDVKGGNSANGTKLQVYKRNQTKSQRFYFLPATTNRALRSHLYVTDPNTGIRHFVEGTFATDPRVSDEQFFMAAIYTEGGNQGIAGAMLVGYSMLNRIRRDYKAHGIKLTGTAAQQNKKLASSLRYYIYEYSQYMICRDGALTSCLKTIKNDPKYSTYSWYKSAINGTKNCLANKDIRLDFRARVYTNGSPKELKAGTVVKIGDHNKILQKIDGFMTPAAFSRHGFSYSGKNLFIYYGTSSQKDGHVYYVTSEVWG